MEEISVIDSICCKEIYVILKKLNLINKLPRQLLEYIYTNQDLFHKFDFDEEIPLIYQIDNEKTKEMITYIYLKYINKNNEEKEYLINKLESNEIKKQEILKEKYSVDNMFDKNKNRSNNRVNKAYINDDIKIKEEISNSGIIEYKESFWSKIYHFILGIFKK